jgi:predicted DNA-binding transcriptional regulator AlpA
MSEAAIDDGEAQESEVLTVPELAMLLRLKTKSVYAMLSRDATAIPGCRKVGRTWRAHRSTVVTWLAGRNSDRRQPQRGVR